MVSLNEEEQPQNQSKFKSVEVAIERSIHDEFEEIQILLNQRKKAMTGFKGKVKGKFLTVEKMLAEIRKMFEDFQRAEDSRIENSPVLTRGLKFFFDHMRLHSNKIIEALDQETKTLTERIEAIASDKKAKIDAALLSYRSTMQQISQVQVQKSLDSSQTEENLKAAIETMRKLPIFGKPWQHRVDFEWPLGKDLLAMPKDKPITLSAMSFKKSEQYAPLGSLQMHFSNGVNSPKFLAKDQSGEGLERINIPQDKKANTIRCRVDGKNISNFFEVALLDKDRKAILNLKAGYYGNYFYQQLEEGEEIIGCYGVKNQDLCFDSLGFIVWKPPKTN